MQKNNREALKNISLKNPFHLIAVGFGSGLSPYAPGTCGSVVAIPFCLLLIEQTIYVQLGVVAAVFLVGWLCSSITEKALGTHDNSAIVIDEFLGMFISVIALQTWHLVLVAFLLFRFFDILKPYPIRALDRGVPGGFGVMLDDVVAGLYALVCGHIVSNLCFGFYVMDYYG